MAATTGSSAVVAAILADKKLMNRLAWKVAWRITLKLLPWYLVILGAMWLGMEITLRVLLR